MADASGAVVRVAVIGTSGRDRMPTAAAWGSMLRRTRETLARWELPPERICLVSGGAAWADHVAVALFLAGEVGSLVLHLPAIYDAGLRVFADSIPGARSNELHRRFSSVVGRNSLAELGEALASPKCVSTVSSGFLARNVLVARADRMIAITSGRGVPPQGSGTGHTWKLFGGNPRWRVHIDLA